MNFVAINNVAIDNKFLGSYTLQINVASHNEYRDCDVFNLVAPGQRMVQENRS